MRDLERLSRALHRNPTGRRGTYSGRQGADARRSARRTARSTDLSRALEARALVWQRQGDYPKARVDLERAVALLEADYPSGHPETADALTLLGAQLSREGDAAAEPDDYCQGCHDGGGTLSAGPPSDRVRASGISRIPTQTPAIFVKESVWAAGLFRSRRRHSAATIPWSPCS